MHIFFVYISQSEAGSGLLVDEGTQSCLSFNEAVWNLHLSAESWDVEHQFNWDDIMSNDDELGSLVFNQGGYVVQTEFDVHWLVTVLLFFVLVFVLGLFLESLPLVLLGLWSVLGQQGEEFVGLVSLQGVGELVDLSWNEQSVPKDLLLSIPCVRQPFTYL